MSCVVYRQGERTPARNRFWHNTMDVMRNMASEATPLRAGLWLPGFLIHIQNLDSNDGLHHFEKIFMFMHCGIWPSDCFGVFIHSNLLHDQTVRSIWWCSCRSRHADLVWRPQTYCTWDLNNNDMVPPPGGSLLKTFESLIENTQRQRLNTKSWLFLSSKLCIYVI